MATEVQWHVVGAGAIGCLFAESLHRAGAHITLILRDGDHGGDIQIERGPSISTVQLPWTSASNCTAIHHLLVTTKAYDVSAAVAQVADKLSEQAAVLVMVNGMGVCEELSAHHAGLNLFQGTTTAGAYRRGRRHIRHTGIGATRIGGGDQVGAPAWFGLWQSALDDCSWDEQINDALWHKLAINCVINPLTAVHRCRNGELSRNADLAVQVTALCAEICRVSEAAGFGDTAATLPADVAGVISGTAENRSSMLQDVEAGRATEIDYITGHLLKVAAAHGVPTPRNQALYEKVRSLAH